MAKQKMRMTKRQLAQAASETLGQAVEPWLIQNLRDSGRLPPAEKFGTACEFGEEHLQAVIDYVRAKTVCSARPYAAQKAS